MHVVRSNCSMAAALTSSRLKPVAHSSKISLKTNKNHNDNTPMFELAKKSFRSRGASHKTSQVKSSDDVLGTFLCFEYGLNLVAAQQNFCRGASDGLDWKGLAKRLAKNTTGGLEIHCDTPRWLFGYSLGSHLDAFHKHRPKLVSL